MSEQTGNGGAGSLGKAVVRVTGSASTDVPREQDIGITGTGLGDLFIARVQVMGSQHPAAGSLAAAGREVAVRDLYPALAEVGPSRLADAIRLFEEARRDVEEALQHLDGGDTLGADDALMRFRALLPELFACRELGDGFAMVIGALIVAFHRHATESMTEPEIRAVRGALAQAQREPYMVEEVGSNTVDALEDAGLQVRLSGLDRLLDDGEESGAESVP